ncbi:NAD-dependent epimerase/dehydratase family protein [Yersinia bercovieri]|uniref:NAD-dependent epimerase/dehydratase family protein n=1 Tax=Yersinia bercovieri TaxID=634 RepID=UPI0005DF97E8|nr:NAD(P)-dependent oxidoreductase [Yersinia bercovieri]EKN3445543.1 NAD(P)-dependent oxidoreductase [Yersinia enterocolitica]EKN4798760.1 NAD(P)-dependent oxidoreductase [Yersinia enterocolitica]CFQ32118.1 paratose synthase [Yersinia bercovieri]
MKILITGVSGYLGSQLANALMQEHEITGTIRSGSECNRISHIDKIKFINVTDNNWVNEVVSLSPDVVINTAALYGRKGEPPSVLVNANIQFPLRILEALAATEKCIFLHCGTSLPANVSQYALTKNQFSTLAKEYCNNFSGKFVDLKLEHFYGPFDDPTKFTTHVINSCKNNSDLKLTAGLQRRDFIYINDLINAFKILISKSENLISGESISIGSGYAITIREFVETVAKITSYQGNLQFGAIPTRENELMYSCASLERVQELGWLCQYPLNSAIKDILYKEYK